MELFTVIYESNNDNLMKQLSEIDVSAIKLSRDEVHIVGSLIARCRHVRFSDLSATNIDAEDMKIIGKYLKNRIHVSKHSR